MTPLHFAVDLSNFDVAEILIRYGADVNARGNVSKITLLLYLLLTIMMLLYRMAIPLCTLRQQGLALNF